MDSVDSSKSTSIKSRSRLDALKIGLAVVAIFFVLGFMLFVLLFYFLRPKAISVTAVPFSYPYDVGQCAFTDITQCIPKDFSVWAFTTNGSFAIEILPDKTLAIRARTWNVNPAQRWTCALQRAGLTFGRGIYVLQSLSDSSRAICVDSNGNPNTCPLNVGDPTQQFAMIRLSSNAISMQSIYALVNQANQKALAFDPTTRALLYSDVNANDENQFWKAEIIPLFGTV